MEIAGEDSFRIRSYRNGATAIEGHPERVEDILKDPERKVTDIPGHRQRDWRWCWRDRGPRLLRAPRSAAAENFPPARSSSSRSRGSGRRASRCMFEHYRISTMDELERLCREEKLRVLPRMGAKLEEKVLRSIAQYRQRTGRYLLSYAEDMARELTAYLGGRPASNQITPAGSLRRGRETVGDLDLLVTGPAAADVLDASCLPRVEKCWRAARTRPAPRWAAKACRWTCARCRRESFGAAMQYFTGSKDHNVAVRTRAVKMGFKLSEYGLFRADDDQGGGRNRSRRLRGAGPALDSAGAARKPGEIEARRRRPPARAGGTGAHPRRPAHAHHRDRRPRHARRNGRGRARARLRIHRHHRSFQGAGHGQRPG
jgi:DNA polymerase (family X)